MEKERSHSSKLFDYIYIESAYKNPTELDHVKANVENNMKDEQLSKNNAFVWAFGKNTEG